MNEALSGSGKNVVVTGVSSGIGKAVAQTMAGHGFRVFGSVRKPEDAAGLQQELGALFEPLLFDVCDVQAIRSQANKVKKMVGDQGVSALVNNAGLALFGPLELIEDDAFEHIMKVNVSGARYVTNAFLPHLRSAHSVHQASKIVNISSLSGIFNTPMNGAYCVSKHAMESLGETVCRYAIRKNGKEDAENNGACKKIRYAGRGYCQAGARYYRGPREALKLPLRRRSENFPPTLFKPDAEKISRPTDQ